MIPEIYSDYLRQGITAAKHGNKRLARDLLLEAARDEPGNELVWLWLASVAESQQDTITYLERALYLKPSDERVQSWLHHLRESAPRARKHWQCPFCACESVVEIEKCPRCHAVVSLKDLDALLGNRDADRPILREMLTHWESLSGDEVDASIHLKIGLAYLNLQRSYEGITRLRVASQLSPDDQLLKTQVTELARRQEISRRAAAEIVRGAEVAQSQRTVLVVDDSPTVLKIVGVALERHGHRVVVASNGLQALAKLHEVRPDLILLDITMPNMDGYQLCKLIRGNTATKDIPVVMLSGKDGFFDKMRGKLAGAQGHISKPFDPAVLVQTLEKHCADEKTVAHERHGAAEGESREA